MARQAQSDRSADTARKLAPGIIGFDSLIGNDSVIAGLRRALGRATLPQAMAFSGPAGVGKATCAALIAQAINCRGSSGTSGSSAEAPSDACGHCVPCAKIARGLHPDVTWVAPEPRAISVAQVRSIVEQVAYAPYEGRRRVVIFDDAHTMNIAAQNALLKTLEEPPPSSNLILVTAAYGSLLPTVRSRCQELRFSPLSHDDVCGYLAGLGVEPREARLRSRLVPGSLGAALSVDLEEYEHQLEVVVSALRFALAGGAGVVTAGEALADAGNGETATQRAASILRVCRDVLRDLWLLASGANEQLLLNPERADDWRDWAAGLDGDRLTRALTALDAGIAGFLSGIQPNIRLAIEQTLADVGGALGYPSAPGSSDLRAGAGARGAS